MPNKRLNRFDLTRNERPTKTNAKRQFSMKF